MVRYFLVFLFSFSTIYAQELNDEWLNTVLEKNISADQTEVLAQETNNIYYTIQIAAKTTFSDAQEVLKILNNNDFEAFIIKNDSSEKLKYRIRYGNFLSKEDASMTANDIKNELGYDCWIAKIEL
ncbi:MAG: SPOR domain-containing protein [Candidatus Marinimicrobia bacterium]|jgi:cell division septation protein DedD|nr:SPOR domain-containing protein [Candidatus Neomarinimicrobiota bacterium]MBT3728409.1 SPOR domain-containing protein [Candidatus Neomarinimicrobiota bacterium]MBT3944049.1 SPOR domain-containing protein [Candidatus Neomarinimicrobiota bacterium]MBT4111773.1 SPOR domain-containing protein [Candidatus Neomarinimicrobiota bacterium]MBT4317270.1 SPOR domain-containing protein [Candidatus Neomarinimicrobiota bacterium]